MRRVALGGALPVLLLATYTVWTSGPRNPYFPPPSAIAACFGQLWLSDHLLTDVLPSLRNLLLGYTIAVVVSVAAGVVLGLNRVLRLLFTGQPPVRRVAGACTGPDPPIAGPDAGAGTAMSRDWSPRPPNRLPLPGVPDHAAPFPR